MLYVMKLNANIKLKGSVTFANAPNDEITVNFFLQMAPDIRRILSDLNPLRLRNQEAKMT